MGLCLQGTLFTPLDKTNTSSQSLNVQLRKRLDLHVNLVHGFSIPGLKLRHDDLDIVVIRCPFTPPSPYFIYPVMIRRARSTHLSQSPHGPWLCLLRWRKGEPY